MLHPPTPTSEREFLIEIYARLQHMHEMLEEIAGDLHRQNDRITRLETWRNRAAGALIVVGMLTGAVVTNVVRMVLTP